MQPTLAERLHSSLICCMCVVIIYRVGNIRAKKYKTQKGSWPISIRERKGTRHCFLRSYRCLLSLPELCICPMALASS